MIRIDIKEYTYYNINCIYVYLKAHTNINYKSIPKKE